MVELASPARTQAATSQPLCASRATHQERSARRGAHTLEFDKDPADYSIAVHVVPFLYYVLYTFLLHQMVLDVSGARENEARKKLVDVLYVVGFAVVYSVVLVAGL